MLAYYLGSSDYATSVDGSYHLRESGGLRIVASRVFQFRDNAELHATLSDVRRTYGLAGPLWVAAGGFYPAVKAPASDVHSFSNAIAIFRTQ